MREDKYNSQRVSIQAIVLMIYFILMPVDVFKLGNLGTILKLFAFAVVIVFLLSGITKIRNDKVLKYGISYLLLCAFSIIFSLSFDVSVSIFITMLLNFALIFVTCNIIVFNPREVEWLHAGILIGSWLTIVLTLIFLDFSDGGRLTMMIGESSADQNYINGYLFFGLSFSIWKIINGGKRKILLVLSVLAAMMFTLYTGSRGALLAEACIVFVAVITSFILSKKKLGYIIGAVVLFLVLIFGFNNILQILPPEISMRFSLQYITTYGTSDRAEIWSFMLNKFFGGDIFHMLFGYGIGTSSIFNTMDRHVAHNAFIDIMIGTGIFGVIFYVLLLKHALKLALRSKNYEFFICMIGFIMLSMSLSLITYKPIFNCIMMSSIIGVSRERYEEV